VFDKEVRFELFREDHKPPIRDLWCEGLNTGNISVRMKFGIKLFCGERRFDASDFHRLPQNQGAGFDGIEYPSSTRTRVCGRYRRELQRVGLECTAVAIMASRREPRLSGRRARSSGQRHVMSCIRRAAEMGTNSCPGRCIAVGYFTGRRRTQDE